MKLTWIGKSITTKKNYLITLFIISFHSQQLKETELHLHPLLSIVYFSFLDTYIHKLEEAKKYQTIQWANKHVPDDITLIYACNIYCTFDNKVWK